MKDMLKRDKWWFWLILLLCGGSPVLGIILALVIENVFDQDAWYAKWQYWLIGILFCIFPAIIMFTVFQIQVFITVAKKLEVPGDALYATPYTWLICLIVPILGWILFAVMLLYLEIFTIVAIKKGNAEKFIENQ